MVHAAHGTVRLLLYVHGRTRTLRNVRTRLFSGMAKSLKKLLGDSDGTVRWKATEVLFICSNHAIGRDAILEFDLIQPISALFDDQHEDARLMSHRFSYKCHTGLVTNVK